MKKLLFLFLLLSCTSTIPPITDYSAAEQEYLLKIYRHPTTFLIPKEDAQPAWGRAQSWIAKYSDMKFQIVTDYVIQTYKPKTFSGYVDYGYFVSRIDKGDSLYIQVECTTNHGQRKSQNEHILAYYIHTGEDSPTARLIEK